MGLANDRETLRDVLNTVTGVKGYVYRPTTLKPGDAWPILPQLDLEQGLAWRPTWRIVVALSSDEREASQWVDTHFEDLVLALRGPAWPDGAEMAVMQTEAGDRFILLINLKPDPE